MRDLKENPRKFIVFIDCLGDDDVENHTEFIKSRCYNGQMWGGSPYVTPKVLGEIYTGENPAEHGLPAVSRYDQDARSRPALPTLPEIVAEDETYANVCNFGLPFILSSTVDNPNGVYWHKSQAMGQQTMAPPQAQAHLATQGPAGDISDLDADDNIIFLNRQDNITQTFAQARSIAHAQDFDVMFISCRTLDEYCHHRYKTMDPSADVTDRQELIRVIDREIQLLDAHGDVFVFGDHGATELEHVFKINRWLLERDYLSAAIDEEFREQAIERGLMDEPDTEGTVHTVGMPHVEIHEDESVAVSDDPFSGGLTLLDAADEEIVEEMIEELEATPYVDEVEWTMDKWEGELLDEAPDLYPRRAVGTFISGNLAEEMGGAEVTRSGVHHPTAAWGATTDLETSGEIEPTDLFDVILREFLGIEEPQTGGGKDYEVTETDEQAAKSALRDLGYL